MSTDVRIRECHECSEVKQIDAGWRCRGCRELYGATHKCIRCERYLGEAKFYTPGSSWCIKCHQDAAAQHHEENRELRTRKVRERDQRERDELQNLRNQVRELQGENRQLRENVATLEASKRYHAEDLQYWKDRYRALAAGDTKVCNDCNEDKPLTEFGKFTSRGVTRRRSVCNPCRKHAARKERQKT